MKKISNIFAVVAIIAMMFVSCSKDSNPSSSNSNSTDIPPNQMNATIDGTSQTFTCYGFKFVVFGDSSIIVVGADISGKGVGVSLTGYRSAGTYQVGVTDTTGGAIRFVLATYTFIASAGDTVEYAPPTDIPGKSYGQLIITTLTDSVIKGTFNATLPKKKGIAGGATVAISGGFNTSLQ
ncbi:MAG TPA: hypothetical protein VEW28_02170 [Candidatus Kapabacteria bacterium]|nr:hypothetical protein [Candidatus Kapabacteria bacterium]